MNREAHKLAASHKSEMQVLWPETYHLRPVENLVSHYGNIPADRNIVTNPATISEYSDAEIFFNAAVCAIWASEGSLSFQYGLKPAELGEKFNQPAEQLDNVLLLGDSPGAHCYYHWMLDILPKIELLRRNGIEIKDFDAILVRELNGSFQKETLLKLGVELPKVFQTKEKPRLSCQSLTTVHIDNCINMKMHRCIPEWHRYSFSEKPSDSPERKIYVSRPKGVRRGVDNEESLLPLLSEFGYEIHKMEGMSVAQQAELFSQSRVVISAHGGALTNMVYMAPGGHIVELFGGHVYPFYYGLSQVCDHRYFAILEDSSDLPRLTSLKQALAAGNLEQQLKTRFANFSVCSTEFAALLESI